VIVNVVGTALVVEDGLGEVGLSGERQGPQGLASEAGGHVIDLVPKIGSDRDDLQRAK